MRPRQLLYLLLSATLALVFSPRLWALQFNRYHSQEEIHEFLQSVALKHPEIARYETIGRSQQGRDINLLTLSRNRNPAAPALYFNATHHGNEKASTEALLALAHHLVERRDQAGISQLLGRYRILIHPLVNPDGHALNTRGDAAGNDPNRDYAGPQKPEREAFQMPETRIVRELLRRERVLAAASFHSGLEAILWPWCHTPESSQHDSVFRALGEGVARSMGLQKAKQSFFDYRTDGEFIDYAYMMHGTYALTLEVATEATPAPEQLASVVERSLKGSLNFLQTVDQLLEKRKLLEASPATEAQAVLW